MPYHNKFPYDERSDEQDMNKKMSFISITNNEVIEVFAAVVSVVMRQPCL